MSKCYIPALENVFSTSDVDGVNTRLGYWGPFCYPMRRRLDLAVNEMRKSRYNAILDAGYGCGIFLPELYRRLDTGGRLSGVDIHDQPQGVRDKMFAPEKMDSDRVSLYSSSLAKLPFEDNSFDLIVSVSVLEHIEPQLLRSCLSEIQRVARPEADIILGFPTDCIFIRALAFIQKQDLKKNHPSTHQDIFKAIKDSGFKIVQKKAFPQGWGPLSMHYNVRVES